MNVKHFLFVAIILQISSVRSDELTDFVTRKLQNYTTWLKSRDLDPTEPIKEPNLFRAIHWLIDLECDVYIRNYRVHGHAHELEINQVTSNISGLHFSTTFTLNNNITITGEHTANGTVLSGTPVNGNGTWYVTGSSLKYEWNMWFYEMDDGYLDLQTSRVGRLPLENEDLYFQNLSDNEALAGYEDYMKESLSNGFRQTWMMLGTDPLPEYYIDYWRGLLWETKMEDIIGNKTLSQN